MSKQAILDKIMSDAREKADAYTAEQSEKAAKITADAEAKCAEYRSDFERETRAQVADILSRSMTVAELDAKKQLLAAKVNVLDRVFERALEKLTALSDKNMKKLLVNMLGNAEDGDTVTLSAAAKDVLSGEDVAKYAAKKRIKLSLSNEYGDFAGGMILSGGGVDKNLTFEVEIAALRESLETEIAKRIFG